MAPVAPARKMRMTPERSERAKRLRSCEAAWQPRAGPDDRPLEPLSYQATSPEPDHWQGRKRNGISGESSGNRQ